MGPRLYESKQVESYVDDKFFAFTRGDKGEVKLMLCSFTSVSFCNTKVQSFFFRYTQVFVATSNVGPGGGQPLTRTINYHPYSCLLYTSDAADE